MSARVKLITTVCCVILFYLMFSFGTPKTTVTKVLAPATTVFSSTTLSAAEYKELNNQLQKQVETDSPTAALKKLVDLMQQYPVIARSCHGLAHEIGHSAYKKYQDFAVAMGYQNDVCGSGYIHGVVEEKFKNMKDVPIEMRTICDLYTSSTEAGKCYHGVGHGLMYYTENNVPKAIALCDTYRNRESKIRCGEGVFMENFSTDLDEHDAPFLKTDDPFYPCQNQPTFFKGACYYYSTIYFLNLHNYDYTAALTWCQGAEKNYRLTCQSGVGSRIMKNYITDIKTAETLCAKGPAETLNGCLDGMLSYYIVNYNSTKKATELCASLLPEHRQKCENSLAMRRPIFTE